MKTQESLKNKPFIISFKPELLTSSSDVEYLEQIENKLRKIGVDPEAVVYSGADGSPVINNTPFPANPAAFVMNGAGWREAIRTGETNPAEYTEQPGKTIPCIVVYDKNQLQETYGGEISQEEDLAEPTKLRNWQPGDLLRDLPPDRPVQESVTHVNYPEASTNDAILGFIFIDQD